MLRIRLLSTRAIPGLYQSRSFATTFSPAFRLTTPASKATSATIAVETPKVKKLPVAKKVKTEAQKVKDAEKKAKSAEAKAKKSLKDKEEKAALRLKSLAKKRQEKEIVKLTSKLVKEKAWLATLRTRYREAAKKHEAKEEAKAKKVLSEALKQYRKLNSYAFFIKTQKGLTLLTAKEKWLELSDSEKAELQARTDAYNEEQLKIYKPKPKKPATGFALYVKENFVSDGRSVVEINKELSKKWNALTPEEKSAYSIDQSTKDNYKHQIDEWTKKRIEIYNAAKA